MKSEKSAQSCERLSVASQPAAEYTVADLKEFFSRKRKRIEFSDEYFNLMLELLLNRFIDWANKQKQFTIHYPTIRFLPAGAFGYWSIRIAVDYDPFGRVETVRFAHIDGWDRREPWPTEFLQKFRQFVEKYDHNELLANVWRKYERRSRRRH